MDFYNTKIIDLQNPVKILLKKRNAFQKRVYNSINYTNAKTIQFIN